MNAWAVTALCALFFALGLSISFRLYTNEQGKLAFHLTKVPFTSLFRVHNDGQ